MTAMRWLHRAAFFALALATPLEGTAEGARQAPHGLAAVADALRGAVQPPSTLEVDTPAADAERITARLRQGDAEVRIFVSRRPLDDSHRDGVLLPSLLWQTDPRDPGVAWQAALAQVQAAVRRVDQGQYAHTHKDRQASPPPPRLLVAETWLLLAVSVWALGRALRRSWSGLPTPHRLWTAALLVAWLVRALAPHRLVMVHFGWLHFDQAVSLAELPRYGPATTLLHHAWLRCTPHTPASIQWLHTVLGTLTIVPMAAWTVRLLPAARREATAQRAAWATAVTMALLPVAVLDHGSESMLVPAMLWWWSGAVLLADGLAGGPRQRADLVAAVVLLALCGLCRPDCMLLALPTAWMLASAARPALRRAAWRLVLTVTVVLALLWLPGALYVRERAAEDLARGNLPRLAGSFWVLLPRRLADGWLVLRPAWFAAGVTLLAVAAVAVRALARAWLLLWGAALLWAVPMLIDFNDSSALRLHMPSATLVVVLAALAWAHLERRAAQVTVAVAVAATAILTGPEVMAPQNSDAVDDAIHTAARLARDGRPTVLVGRSYADEPAFGVHLFWPATLLEPDDHWMSVRDWQAGRAPRGVQAIGVIDGRCWAHLAVQRPQLGPSGLHPACAALMAATDGAPLWQRATANQGERGFDWYPPRGELPRLAQRIVRLRPL